MAKKNKRNKTKISEEIDRYCPICGDAILKGETLHKCDENKIKYLYTEDKEDEDQEPSYDEKLNYGNFLSNLMENDYDDYDEKIY